MLPYCLKCRKNTQNKNPKVIILLSKCVVCDSKKSKFSKEQEANGFLSSLGIRHLLIKFLY